MLSSNSRSGASFFIAQAWRLNVCLWVTTLVSLTPAKNCRFFSDQAGHDLEMKQPVRRVVQLATLKATNGSPGISRHRSYTRQTKEVKNFANFVFQFRRKQLTVVLGTAISPQRTSEQRRKWQSNAQCVMLWPQRHHLQKQGEPFSIELDRESFRLTSFGLAKAHRANENALRTWMVLVRRSTSDTFARSRSLPTISCKLTLTVVCVPIENVRQCEVDCRST